MWGYQRWKPHLNPHVLDPSLQYSPPAHSASWPMCKQGTGSQKLPLESRWLDSSAPRPQFSHLCYFCSISWNPQGSKGWRTLGPAGTVSWVQNCPLLSWWGHLSLPEVITGTVLTSVTHVPVWLPSFSAWACGETDMLPFHHSGLVEKWLKSSFIHQKLTETLSHAKHLMGRSAKSLLFPKLFGPVKDTCEQDPGRERGGGGEAQLPRGDTGPGQCSLRGS